MLALALLLLGTVAQGRTEAEFYALADKFICPWEVRGENDPRNAQPQKGEEIGWCQMKPSTARFLKVPVSHLTGKDRGLAVQAAVEWLRYCYRRGWRTTYELAHCYNAGPDAQPGVAHRYARQIASDHATEWLRLRMQIRLARR